MSDDKSWLDNLTIGSDDCEQGRHTKCRKCSCTCHPRWIEPEIKTGTPLKTNDDIASEWSYP